MITIPPFFWEYKDIQYVNFHYCSEETFFKIIDERKIRLTAIDKVNDYAEGLWLIRQVYKICLAKTDENPNLREQYNHILKTLNDCINDYLSYICCLSANGDLLSQWCRYADDGKGVAFSLVSNKLESKMMAVFDGFLPKFGDCTGNALVQYKDFQEIEKWLSVAVGQLLGSNDLDDFMALAKWAIVFKNPAFMEEAEWCIILSPKRRKIRQKTWEIEDKGLAEKLKFRPSAKGLISYFEL